MKMDLKVTQLENKNQFVIEKIVNNRVDYTFQSYDTTICKIDNNKETIVFDNYILNGSNTTYKHLYIFLQRYYNQKYYIFNDLDYKWNKKRLLDYIDYNNITIKNLNR